MRAIVACSAALLAQSTFLHHVQWHGGVISLVIIPLVMTAYRATLLQALTSGALCGFAEDVLCGSGLAWTCATVMVVLLVQRAAQTIDLERRLFMVVAISVAVAARDLLFWLIEVINGSPLPYLGYDLHISMWNMCLTAGAAVLCVVPLQRLLRAER